MATANTSTTTEGKQTVKESTIRLMTRLADEYKAVNLSQGFPNEAPPLRVRLALARATLCGMAEHAHLLLKNEEQQGEEAEEEIMREVLKDAVEKFLMAPGIPNLITSNSNSSSSNSNKIEEVCDALNQYSPPMGRLDLRQAIANHYSTLYNHTVDPNTSITVTLGATEAIASALRSIGTKPGKNKVVIFEPYHEIYPSQCQIFYLEPIFVTLRQSKSIDEDESSDWYFDPKELENALSEEGVVMLMLNTPHNPTGKVFTYKELQTIVHLCSKYNIEDGGIYIITDEIYEFMTYERKESTNTNNTKTTANSTTTRKHILLAKAFPNCAHKILTCNSVGKSASATGWRIGWCLHPPHLCHIYRAIHDQMVVMAPHPQQYATMTYLSLPQSYFTQTLKTRYKDRIWMLAKSLRKVGFRVTEPEGAYYLFVRYDTVPLLQQYQKPMDVAMYMIRHVGVACVPGDNFYGSKHGLEIGKFYLRFAACRSISDIQLACQRLEQHFGTTPSSSAQPNQQKQQDKKEDNKEE